MKEFCFLLRANPESFTPEQVDALRAQWGTVIQQWMAEGRFISSHIFGRESHVAFGVEERDIINGPVLTDQGLAAGAVIFIKAQSRDEAVEISLVCPTLDYGGSVEIREIQPRPQAPAGIR